MLRLSISSLESSLEPLTSARQEVESMLADSEQQIIDGEKQLQEGYDQLVYQQSVLDNGLKALEHLLPDTHSCSEQLPEGNSVFPAEYSFQHSAASSLSHCFFPIYVLSA